MQAKLRFSLVDQDILVNIEKIRVVFLYKQTYLTLTGGTSMNEFQQKLIDSIAQYAPIWVVGGAVRDKLMGLESRDIDLVTYMKPEYVEHILKEKGFNPKQIGMRFKTLSVFQDGERIDLVSTVNLSADAQHRDFTMNAIYMNPYTEELYDPWEGSKDLQEKRLKTCGDPQSRFKEDPVRILRMVKFAVKHQMNIDEEAWNEAREQVHLLAGVSRERVTAELAQIFVLEDAEKAIVMLKQLGYWNVFIPELARLKGIVQNQYHSLDVWDHTMAVFRNTPIDLFLRIAALFHDIGKWEVASRECHLGGRLELDSNKYLIGNFQIIGTRGPRELEYKLKPYVGKDIKILGARLDQFPDVVQLKRVLIGEQIIRGITVVENGKRHFLNHEKASARMLEDILKRYTFAMFFDGGGQRREKDLLKLVENHMRATLVFMSEFRGEPSRRSFRDRAAELVWDLCWDGRDYELQNIHDFVVLWKADFEAGKVHTDEQNQLFEKILKELISIALWQKENLPNIEWKPFMEFISSHNLTGPSLGRFKEFIRAKAMKEMVAVLEPIFMQKAYAEYRKEKH